MPPDGLWTFARLSAQGTADTLLKVSLHPHITMSIEASYRRVTLKELN